MRFCFVMLPFEYYSPVSGGAIATVTMNVVREILKKGHEAVVLTADDGQPLYTAGEVRRLPLEIQGPLGGFVSHVEARVRHWDWPNQGRFWRTVRRELRIVSPDVVVLANDLVGASEVRKVLPAVRVVVWVHNECHSSGDMISGLASTDAFLSCSQYIQNWLLEKCKVPQALVHTAYAGVDGDVFFPGKQERTQGLRLLFTGRLDPNKGVDLAVEVVRKLKKSGLPVSLTVAGHSWFYPRAGAGADPFFKRLRKAMTEVEVDWLGHVPRRWIPLVMREHDISLVISRSQEPFGLVVLEAMASGLAVMASPHGGLSEACGEAGIFVDPENTSQIAQKLEVFCADRGQLEAWQRRSIQRAARAKWRSTADVLLKVSGQREALTLGA
jgi:glycosyltransferase involved in cell wall biosynthesis